MLSTCQPSALIKNMKILKDQYLVPPQTLLYSCSQHAFFLHVWQTGILIKMLKNEKKRAQDAAAKLAKVTKSLDLSSQSTTVLSRMSNAESNEEDILDIASTHHNGRAIQYMNKGTFYFFIFFALLYCELAFLVHLLSVPGFYCRAKDQTSLSPMCPLSKQCHQRDCMY